MSLMTVKQLIEALNDWEQKHPGMFVVMGSFNTGHYSEILEKGTIYVMPETHDVAVIKSRERRKKTLLAAR